MLNLDLNIIYTFINIFVLFFFLKKFFYKPVTEVMENRKRTIENSLQDADDRKAEAYQLKDYYEEQLKQADEQATLIVKEAKERAELEYNRILKNAKDEAAKVMVEANKSIEIERKKSIEKAQAEIAGLAMVAAAKIIGKNVDDDTNTQMLGDFIKEVGASK